MDGLPSVPIGGLIVSAAGPILRILRDRFAPPQRGLRYFDLEVKPDGELSNQIADGDGEPGNASKNGRKPYTHFVKIVNYGREVIDQSDYIRPFSVQYGEAVQVVGYRIVQDNQAVRPRIYCNGSDTSGILIREILNPGDTLTVGVLLAAAGNPGNPVIDCRIKGIHRIKGHVRGTPWLTTLARLGTHYFAIPTAIIAGLVIGYRVYLASGAATPSLIDTLSFLADGFGTGLLWGILIAGSLVTAVEAWETLSFRRQRQAIEESFRAAARERLDRPVPL